MSRSETDGALSRSGRVWPKLLAGALVWLLWVAPAPVAAQEIQTLEIGPDVRHDLAQIQEAWVEWLTAYYHNDPDRAASSLVEIRSLAAGLGMPRLPDLSVAAAARAVQFAQQADHGRAAWGIRTAEELDPGRPETSFAAATAARLEGRYFVAMKEQLRGYLRTWNMPTQRFVWLSNAALWALSAVLLAGLAFVGLEMATRGVRLFRDLYEFFARLMPPPVAYTLGVVLLVWPILLPSGLFWVVGYWTILVWAYCGAKERAILLSLWLLIAVTPIVVQVQGRLVGVALSRPMRAVDATSQDRLAGSLFTDLAVARSILPDSVAVKHLLADLHRRLGEGDSARRLYLEVLEAEPENEAALVDAGACYFEDGNLEQALDLFQRATAVGEASAAAHFNLSRTTSELYRFGEAERELGQARHLAADEVSEWMLREASAGAVTVDGGLDRVGEIRPQIVAAWGGGEGSRDRSVLWRTTLAMPLVLVFILIAITIYLTRRRVSPGRTPIPVRWWRGGADLGRRILIVGLPEAEREQWGRALLWVVALFGLIILPWVDRIGYRVPWRYDPGRSLLWLVTAFGVAVYVALRVMKEARIQVSE